MQDMIKSKRAILKILTLRNSEIIDIVFYYFIYIKYLYLIITFCVIAIDGDVDDRAAIKFMSATLMLCGNDDITF